VTTVTTATPTEFKLTGNWPVDWLQLLQDPSFPQKAEEPPKIDALLARLDY
jgi:hypothetical protein